MLRDLSSGILINPQQPGDTADVVVLNNTMEHLRTCLTASANSGTTIEGRFENNLSTNSTGTGVDVHAGTGATVTMHFAHNGYFNNALGNFISDTASVPDGGAAFDADPRYIDRAGGDLRLYSDSPALDAGSNQAPLITDDHAGTARPQGAAFDIGAYEGAAATPPPSRAVAPIPTLGEWALLALGLLAAGLGGAQVRRRR